MRAIVVLLLVILGAGCFGGDAPTPTTSSSPPLPPSRVVSFDSLGATIPVAPDAAGLSLGTYYVGYGGEPNVGVTSVGNIFVTTFEQTARSEDHGKTWKVVFNQFDQLPPSPVSDTLLSSSDPMLWVDQRTDRVYTDHMLSLACSNLSWSDNEGDTWTFRPIDCGILVNDHQKVASGPWHGPAPQPTGLVYDGVLYYCYNKLVATNCAVSLDGGFSFAYDRPVTVLATGGDGLPVLQGPCGGINGHPAPAPDGTMYVPMTLGCPGPVVGVTTDNGLTWTIRQGPTEFGAEEIDPEITVTPDGTAYMLWRGTDHLQHLARSHDQFGSWEGPWTVSPPGVTSTVFAGLTSQENGRLAMGFLGTRDSSKYPEDAENATRWHLYFVESLDAAEQDPTFTSLQVTPDEDPVQIGCVWLSGGGSPCRNMLDFIDMASDKEGRAVIVFTDGCTTGADAGDCANNPSATNEMSRGRDVTVAVLENGPSLLAGKVVRDGVVVDA